MSIVVDRWKNIFSNIGFIDDAAIFVCAVFTGQDEQSVQKRRNVLRYMCLTQVLVLRDISLQASRGFSVPQRMLSKQLMRENVC